MPSVIAQIERPAQVLSASRRNIHREIEGRELGILRDLSIPWPPPRGRKHINCPNPDHADKNPSWRYDPRKRRFYCSRCGSGTIVDVVMLKLGIDFVGACEWLRGGSIQCQPPDPDAVARRQAEREREEGEAAEYWAKQLRKAIWLWSRSEPVEGSRARSRSARSRAPCAICQPIRHATLFPK
jgi:hypothetical protein